MIKMIVAVDRGNAIGWADGRLPWKLPNDMKRFKELTTGHTVVMGFNTFKSLGRLNGLPNRKNIVLTRKNPLEARGLLGNDIDIISSLDYVERVAKTEQDLWIIGGASVYAEALERDMVDEIYITLVDDNSGGDVTLTADFAHWKHWLLTEEKAGRLWSVQVGTHQYEGELGTGLYTTYLLATRIRNTI